MPQALVNASGGAGFLGSSAASRSRKTRFCFKDAAGGSATASPALSAVPQGRAVPCGESTAAGVGTVAPRQTLTSWSSSA